MGRSFLFLLLVAAAAGGWFALQRYEIHGLDDLELVRRDGSGRAGSRLPAAKRDQTTIRIASFNIQKLGPTKVGQLAVMEIVARIIHEFDVVAIQEICSQRPEVLRSLLDHVNESGRHYAILAGPPLGRTSYKEQYAFLFDEETVEADRSAFYSVDDPDDLLHRPPLVGWFRARGPAPDKAFTFTLVNVHTDPDETVFETAQLDSVFYHVRDDGRNEDDVIMLGDFNVDDQHLGDLTQMPGMLTAIAATPTNTRQTQQYDNLLFQLPATDEYAGRSGVFDFMREYNLTLEQALQVSDHLPVWASFSTVEGGDNPAVAGLPGAGPQR